MSELLGLALKVLGIGGGASPLNNAGGALSHLAFIPVIAYCITHASDKINFGEVSMAFLAIVAFLCYMFIEAMRRSRAPVKGEE